MAAVAGIKGIPSGVYRRRFMAGPILSFGPSGAYTSCYVGRWTGGERRTRLKGQKGAFSVLTPVHVISLALPVVQRFRCSSGFQAGPVRW